MEVWWLSPLLRCAGGALELGQPRRDRDHGRGHDHDRVLVERRVPMGQTLFERYCREPAVKGAKVVTKEEKCELG
jgi:hypothetical protein